MIGLGEGLDVREEGPRPILGFWLEKLGIDTHADHQRGGRASWRGKVTN